MPSLLLPVNSDRKDVSQSLLPELPNHFLLAGDPWIAMKQPGLDYWYQEIKVNGFIIGQVFCNTRNQLSIDCRTDEPCAILYYSVADDIHFERAEDQVVVLPAGNYGLLVCPAKALISLHFPGERHHGIQLSISIHLLQHLPGFTTVTDGLSILSADYVQFLFPLLPINKSIRSIWNHYLFQSDKIQPDYLQLNEGCLKLLGRFSTDWATARQQQSWKERREIRMEELDAYLKDHLDVESRYLTTEKACAKKVGMNIYQFRKLWKERSGKTLTQYLLQSRMERARQLLLTKEETPATIYLRVGYQDFSSFSRAFSAWFGYPPSRVKR